MDAQIGVSLPTAKAVGATLLIVDDVPENLSVLSDLLRGAGYRVKVANSGRVALRYAAQEPKPGLILLDVMMPEMDGYEVLSQLRAAPATRDIQVIFLTTLVDPRDEAHGLELGAADYISKPIVPAVVLARVHTQMVAKEARDWLREQNSLLEAEVARRLGDNQTIQDVSIRALARLAEIRDTDTGDHIRRTQGYVAALAKRLAGHPRFRDFLTDHNIAILTKSAPLHDIGKVGIPDHILLKPGRLTPEEFEIMKTHAKLGSDAISGAEKDAEKPIEFLAIAREIAHWHHERWNGTGYPDGLVGEAIPIAARVMAVADVFDALVSPRTYKASMSFEEARDIVAAERGRHFDPDIADTFLEHYDEFKAIATRYQDGD